MRAVAIGGGHGASRTLRALRTFAEDTTAVVTVADDGGSSGRLRRDLGVLPPGDLRMALTSLAPASALTALVEHRFSRGELAGHSLGNLLLVGLLEQHDDDMVAALDVMADLLRIPGRVLPCTQQSVTLQASVDGRVIDGQAAIAATSRLESVWLQPYAPAATPAVIDAIERADLVVLGPGSLFTSLLPNLLVPAVACAVRECGAPVVFVANIREQLSETQGLTLVDHLDVLARHVGDLGIDVMIVHDAGGDGALVVDEGALARYVGVVVGRSLALDGDLAAGHDPDALAGALRDVIDAAGSSG